MGEGPTRARRVPTVVRYTKTRVAVTRGPDAGLVFEVAHAPLRIGTSPENDLVLADDTVSRRHAEIEPTPTGVRIRDMGSTNGVMVGGMRIYDAVMPGELRLQVGETELTVTPLRDTVAREQAQDDSFGDAIGKSARMRELFADLERIAPSDATVLIEGETGTGKDIVAESVHRFSPRADGPFVVFDCGAVATSLAESELFGHERGAFTGAVASHSGVFQQAHGGTLFLDEIGELPKDLQPKLLRVLEKRVIKRVGGTTSVAVDVRVIAATNRNLRVEVQRGNFREDLYFRLATAHVVVPPLRDRMDDLEALVAHFLSLEAPPRSLDDVPEAVWEMFRAHRWPGNVRELRNAVKRLMLTPDRPLRDAGSRPSTPPRADALGADSPSQQPLMPLRVARREASDTFERAYLENVLTRTGSNVTRAAAIAEVSRQMMQKLMRKHGVVSRGAADVSDPET
jgi:transcriptional regulator with GAF, ATPase, and Fis domain